VSSSSSEEDEESETGETSSAPKQKVPATKKSELQNREKIIIWYIMLTFYQGDKVKSSLIYYTQVNLR